MREEVEEEEVGSSLRESWASGSEVMMEEGHGPVALFVGINVGIVESKRWEYRRLTQVHEVLKRRDSAV